jgi:hypothetical protein
MPLSISPHHTSMNSKGLLDGRSEKKLWMKSDEATITSTSKHVKGAYTVVVVLNKHFSWKRFLSPSHIFNSKYSLRSKAKVISLSCWLKLMMKGKQGFKIFCPDFDLCTEAQPPKGEEQKTRLIRDIWDRSLRSVGDWNPRSQAKMK